MAHTEVLGATQAVDARSTGQPSPEDELERAVLESETISAGGAEDDLIGAMTRTLVPGTLALQSGPNADTAAHAGEVPPSGAPDDRSGEVIHDRYKLVCQLGKGGMGTVYIARHTTLPKTFAVKVLNARYAKRLDIAERFLQEAKAVSLIDHENVVGVIDFGREDDGAAFLVMEHLHGESLGAVCKREAPLSWPRVQHIMLQLCRALAAAHAAGVVHRDIKPDNILRVDRYDDSDFIKVLDFGLAKLQVGGGLRLTATGMVLGTPDYMSPEQARGLPSDHRADIYASGIMMYELLCGRVPFQATTFAALRQKHLLEPPEPPSKWVPELSPEIDAIVLRALAKDPDYRFASMAEMGEAIQAVGSGRAPVELGEQRTSPLLAERSLITAPSSKRAPDMVATKVVAHAQLEPIVASSIIELPSNRRAHVALVVGVAALLGVGGFVFGSRRARVELRPDPAQVAVADAASEPSGDASSAIVVRFETNVPVVVRDLEGRTPFGEQPTHELHLPSSTEPLRLVLAAEGYRELHVVVTPDRDQILAATLELLPEPVEPDELEPPADDSAAPSVAGPRPSRGGRTRN